MSQYQIKIAQGLTNNPGGADVRRWVFMEEQGFQNEFDHIDDIAYHAVVFDKDLPIATGRIFVAEGDPPERYHFGRIAVVKEYRGQGLGRTVMDALMDQAIKLGGKTGVLSAQTQAEGFYRTLGFVSFGPVYNDEHCPHIDMEISLGRRL